MKVDCIKYELAHDRELREKNKKNKELGRFVASTIALREIKR